LVKKYHPDARVSQGSKDTAPEPNVEKFRDVTEAYSVLSVSDSRVNYDLSRKKNPDLYRPVSEKQFDMENRRDLRDKRGVAPTDKTARGSYAEERLQQLKKDRDQYSVNFLGYYKGGVPQKDRGPMRSRAMGNPGEHH
jgi:DnaJ-class molecular chaperone